ncbi:MAG: hypothetical protein JWN78_825 [Bacteroidota bacterium]|nr:hypothetical protein [Bacteroidota bacterium]
MKQTRLLYRRYPYVVYASIFICASIMIAFGCKKYNDQSETTKSTTVSFAKEWFYGVFNQSALFQSYNAKLNGAKLPDWKHGIYKKTGDIEIMEYPLVKARTKVFLPQSNSKRDNLKIAEGTLTRIVFFKRPNGEIIVRELDYVPDLAYLEKKGFDISDVSIGNIDKGYSGKLIVRKWDGTELSRRIILNGKIIKSGRLSKTNPQSNGGARLAGDNCVTFLVTIFQTFCDERWNGDELVRETCYTEIIDSWYEEYCVESNDCSSGMTIECICQLYGICDGNETPVPPCETACADVEEALQTASAGEELDYRVGVNGGAENGNGETYRTVTPYWTFFRQPNMLSHTWDFTASYEGKHYLTNGVWCFRDGSLAYTGTTQGGAQPACITQTCSVMEHPTMFVDAQHYRARLKFKLQFSSACLGGQQLSPVEHSMTSTFLTTEGIQ